MILTLDNGENITIYENNDLIKQVSPYIDKEIYDLLSNKYNGMDEKLSEYEHIKEELEDCNNAYEDLEQEKWKLCLQVDDLEEDNTKLENKINKVYQLLNEIICNVENQSIDNKNLLVKLKTVMKELEED